ncbi:MAG: hypothetical protein ACYC0X_07060 [Pirellulaceae bacterium]
MTRYVAIVVAAWMLAGCRAPAPSFDVLAPYGSPTVPAPRTGAIGTSGTYYAPMNQGAPPAGPAPVAPLSPDAAPPVFAPQSQRLVPPASYMGAADTTSADGTTDVSMASYQAVASHQVPPPVRTSMDEQSSQAVVGPEAGSSSTLKLRGMPVNDGTQPDEPQSFTPAGEPVNISSVPPGTSNSPSFLRFINPKTASGGGGGATAATVPTTTASTTTASTTAWQTR